MKHSFYCVDKDENDSTGTVVRSAQFSSGAPGAPGFVFTCSDLTQEQFDSLSVGASYDFTLSGPSA